MFKLIRTFISSIFLVFSLVFAYGWIQKESFVERILQEAIGCPITVSKIRLHGKGLILKHVYIYNPIQSDIFPYAFEAESIRLDIAFLKLLFKIPELENIVITKGCFNILLPSRFSKDSNWSIIFKNLKRDPASFYFGLKKINLYDLRVQSMKPGMRDLQSLYFKQSSFQYIGQQTRQHLSLNDAISCISYLPLIDAATSSPQLKGLLSDIYFPLSKTFKSLSPSIISSPEILNFQQEALTHNFYSFNHDNSKEETIEFLNTFFFR
ncbi:hypothetical protein CLAVI_000753 [Candidatus Clavichlamydia salmonicola]|uniref:hypothetical protein n=1 Tax=Candidatus Clavichlamydia salmonicola TaxID=469812 RepID=UPI0018911B68|nr:hypothetical protein [Candidatus Clavichlamydia salmonicola]MBF5051118.1 hypothetical protein [Candidatus Clavichlamydia salmonicola]